MLEGIFGLAVLICQKKTQRPLSCTCLGPFSDLMAWFEFTNPLETFNQRVKGLRL